MAAFLGRFSSSLGAKAGFRRAAPEPPAAAPLPAFPGSGGSPRLGGAAAKDEAPFRRPSSRPMGLLSGGSRPPVLGAPGRGRAAEAAPPPPPKGGRPDPPRFVTPALDRDVSSAFVIIRSRFVGTLSSGLCWILPMLPMADCAAFARSNTSRYDPFFSGRFDAADAEALPLLVVPFRLPLDGNDGRDEDEEDEGGAPGRRAADDADEGFVGLDEFAFELGAGRLAKLDLDSRVGVRAVPVYPPLLDPPFRFAGVVLVVVRGVLLAWPLDRSVLAFRFGGSVGVDGLEPLPPSPDICARRSPI